MPKGKRPQKKKNAPTRKPQKESKGVVRRLAPAITGLVSSSPLVRRASEWAGGLVDKFLGFGDYKLTTNTVLDPRTARMLPDMHSSKQTFILRHREYIGDITSTTGSFSLSSFPINVGLSDTFPWLALVANCFECYRFRGLIFEYRSLSGDVTTASNQGWVAACVQYNPTAPEFIAKTQIENQLHGQSVKPSENMLIPVECSPQFNSLGEYFIRSGTVASNQNLQFYDMGALKLAVGGNPTNLVPLGELWATYEVELCKPVMSSIIGLDLAYAHYTLTAPSAGAAPFGTAQVLVLDNIGITFNAGSTVCTIPAGSGYRFSAVLVWTGTPAVITLPVITFSNAAYSTTFGINSYGSEGGDTVGFMCQPFDFTVTNIALPTTITLGVAGAFPTAITAAHFSIRQINGSATV